MMVNISSFLLPQFGGIQNTIFQNQLDKFVLGTAKRAGKSHTVAHLVVMCMLFYKCNVLCVRKYHNRVKGSVFSDIVSVITKLGLLPYFKIKTSPYEIEYLATGHQILFAGVNKGTKDSDDGAQGLGSLKFLHPSAEHIIWCEEAYEFGDRDFHYIIGSQPACNRLIEFYTFNSGTTDKQIVRELYANLPGASETFMKEKKYAIFPDGKNRTGWMCASGEINRVNLAPAQQHEFEDIMQTDPILARPFCLGLDGVAGDRTYYNFNNKNLASMNDILRICKTDIRGFRGGVDYGAINDATTAVLVGYTNNHEQVLVLDEYYHANKNNRVFKDIEQFVDDILNFYIYGLKNFSVIKKFGIKIYVDSSAEDLVQLLQKNAGKKLIDGVSLRNYVHFYRSEKPLIMHRVNGTNGLFAKQQLLIADNVKNLIDEIRGSYKELVKKSGAMVGKRHDGNDHVINALEYAFSYMWQRVLKNRYDGLKEIDE